MRPHPQHPDARPTGGPNRGREVWGYVGKKQRKAGLDPEKGDQYTFTALDSTGKAILSYATGKRNATTTQQFCRDLSVRVINRPQITSDGFEPYVNAMEEAFGARADYAQLIKNYKYEPAKDAARRYSPGYVVGVERRTVMGVPRRENISTSYVERSNLTLRMQQRRFTRLTNGFSKKLENHMAPVALFVAHYNLCRVHEATRMTPAMALGVTDHIWTVAELVEAALEGVLPSPVGTPRGPFWVIEGGLS